MTNGQRESTLAYIDLGPLFWAPHFDQGVHSLTAPFERASRVHVYFRSRRRPAENTKYLLLCYCTLVVLQDLLAPSARWTPRLKFGALREKNQVRRKRYCFFPSDRKFARPASGTPQGGGRRSAPYKPHCLCYRKCKAPSKAHGAWRRLCSGITAHGA